MPVVECAPIAMQYTPYFEDVQTQSSTWAFLTSGLRTNGGDTKLQMAHGAPGGGCYIAILPPASTRTAVHSFAFQLLSAPSSTITLFAVVNASGNPGLEITPGMNLRPFIGSSSSTNVTTINANQWYQVDTRVTVLSGTTTIEWELNATSKTLWAVSQVDADLTAARIGVQTSAAVVVTAEFMDFVASYTGADYPLGNYQTYGSLPNADGTHNITTSGDFSKTGTAQDNTSATSYQALNDLPQGSNAAWIKQTVIGSGEYMEWRFFDNVATAPPDVVMAYADYQGDNTGLYTFEIHVYDGVTLSGDLTTGLTKSTTTQRQLKTALTSPPSGGAWTNNKFNGMKMRFGYSSDVTPNPELNSIGLVYAVAAPVSSATSFTSSTVIG